MTGKIFYMIFWLWEKNVTNIIFNTTDDFPKKIKPKIAIFFVPIHVLSLPNFFPIPKLHNILAKVNGIY